MIVLNRADKCDNSIPQSEREVFMKPRSLVLVVVALVLFTTSNINGAQLNFTPVVTVSEEYTDNLFLSSRDEKDSWITRTIFGGTLELLGQTSGAEITYLPSYVWYHDFSDYDGWTQDLLARVWHNFTANTHIELTNGYIRTRGNIQNDQYAAATSDDPLVTPVVEPDRLQRGLEKYYTNATNLRLDHQFGARDTAYAAFSYRIRRDVNDNLQAQVENQLQGQASDYDIWEPTIGATYWLTNFWGIETDFRYSHRDYKFNPDTEVWYGRLRLNRLITRHLFAYAQYEQTLLDYKEETDEYVNYEVYQPSAGINYQLDQNTRIDIGAGWYYQDYDDGDSNEGFFLEALADKVWPYKTGLIGVTLLSGTDIDDGGTSDLGFHLYYEGRVRGEYAFTPRLVSNAIIGYRLDDYPDSNRTDKTLFAGVGLQYQALRWMYVNLDYFFNDVTSDNAAAEYTENRAVLSVTFTPDQPFRLLR